MLYGLIADLVVVVHLAFILFVAIGALLAWRRPWLLLLHAPSLLWSVASVTIAVPCPLTPLEKSFRRLAGSEGYAGGFVDRYIEGVVYPESLTPVLRAMVALAVVVGYAGLYRRRQSVSGMPEAAGQEAPSGGHPGAGDGVRGGLIQSRASAFDGTGGRDPGAGGGPVEGVTVRTRGDFGRKGSAVTQRSQGRC